VELANFVGAELRICDYSPTRCLLVFACIFSCASRIWRGERCRCFEFVAFFAGLLLSDLNLL
jgi:hypothetical protein